MMALLFLDVCIILLVFSYSIEKKMIWKPMFTLFVYYNLGHVIKVIAQTFLTVKRNF